MSSIINLRNGVTAVPMTLNYFNAQRGFNSSNEYNRGVLDGYSIGTEPGNYYWIPVDVFNKLFLDENDEIIFKDSN